MDYKNITIGVTVPTHQMLKEVAKERKTSIYKLGSLLVEEAVQRRQWENGMGPLLPEVEAIMLTQSRRFEKDYGRLAARNALETGTIKRLVLHLLVAAGFHSAAEAKEIERDAYEMARKNLQKPLESIDEILSANRDRP